jgi:hypothetical protein
VAIGTMRTINTAQVAYFERCNGYAPTLVVLGKSDLHGGTERGGDAHPKRVRGHDRPIRDGDAGAKRERRLRRISERLLANAAPVTPGTTGLRHLRQTPRRPLSTASTESQTPFRRAPVQSHVV